MYELIKCCKTKQVNIKKMRLVFLLKFGSKRVINLTKENKERIKASHKNIPAAQKSRLRNSKNFK